jgi:hypothetical protein
VISLLLPFSIQFQFTMPQTFEFDLVTAFNASSLNISEKDFKAANPNEFYLVSLVSVHSPNALRGSCANS